MDPSSTTTSTSHPSDQEENLATPTKVDIAQETLVHLCSSTSSSSSLPIVKSTSTELSLSLARKAWSYCYMDLVEVILCSRCQNPYCPQSCQEKHRKEHKLICLSLVAASRPLPGIPLEVLERIISYTFLRRTATIPSSDPFPLHQTTHLLLVSRAFRELCLPWFYYSITITRPSHYVTFFDPENGLFAGEDGKKRWKYVRELSIVNGVDPPVLPRYDDTRETSMVPLVAPTGHELNVVCELERREDLVYVEHDPNFENLIASNEGLRASVLEDLREEFREDVGALPFDDQELEAWVLMYEDGVGSLDDVLLAHAWERTFTGIQCDRQVFYQELVEGGRPFTLRFPADVMRNHVNGVGDAAPTNQTIFEVYSSSLEGAFLPPHEFHRDVALVQSNFNVGSVRLEGFDSTFFCQLEEWIKKSGFPPDGEEPSGRSFPYSTLTWTGTLDDGSIFSLSPPTKKTSE